jgi:hypothetical protein
MKYVFAFLLAISTAASACDAETVAQIEQLRAEIARRQAAIETMKQDGRATGRFEMQVQRLQWKLRDLSKCSTEYPRGQENKTSV